MTVRTPSVTIEIERTWDGEPTPASERVRLALATTPDEWVIQVDAPYHDDPRPMAEVGSTEGLWEYEVVELFLLADAEHYLEIELGPHGHHLVLAFQGPRQRRGAGRPIEYAVERGGNRWTGEARVSKSYLSGEPHAFNAYAIHGLGKARRYLAAAPVVGERPDFHQLECFQPLRFS
jgi:hypothetical protein